MNRITFDLWEDIPREMRLYLKHYGKHFNKKMYEFAISNMYRKDDLKKDNKIKAVSIIPEQVDSLMKKYNYVLENNTMYDACYVYSMGSIDFPKSLGTEQSLCCWVKEYVDDVDQIDGFIFNRFYADCMLKGVPIDWESLL